MTIYLANADLTHIRERSLLKAGMFISDDKKYDPEPVVLSDGRQLVVGWFADRKQSDINLLLQNQIIDRVDKGHEDFDMLNDAIKPSKIDNKDGA